MTMRGAAPVFAWIALAGFALAGDDPRFGGLDHDGRATAIPVSQTGSDAPVSRARGGAEQAVSLLALPALSFKDIDINSDGKISFDELYRADAPLLTTTRGQ